MAFNYSFRVAVSLAVALLAGVMWTVDVFWGALCTALLPIALYWQQKLYRHHVRKVLFMLDAIENNDNAIHFSETENTADARLVNRALNRVAHILYNVKSETAQQEKYYVNPEKPDVPLNKNDAFQKVQKRRVQEKR